jgi:hypothetical protein
MLPISMLYMNIKGMLSILVAMLRQQQFIKKENNLCQSEVF